MDTLMICPEKKVSDKVLSDKAYNIAKNPIYDGYQRGRALMVYIFFCDKVYVTCTDKSARDVLKNAVTEREIVSEASN